MVENSYLQFPLCALSFGKSAHERLNAILDYGVVEAGSRLFRKLTAEQQREFLAGLRQAGKIPRGFDSKNWLHHAALYGAHVIGVIFYDVKSNIERRDQLLNYVAACESRHGRDAKVRIKKDWLFNARDHHGLSYREFAVLCAIYSAIGDKELAIITRDRIRRCALGYRSAAIMTAELPGRTDKAQQLTERQLRDTVARLHENRFFARSTVFRRITYYSIRLDSDALRKKIVERRTYREFFHANQSALDATMTAAIKQRRRDVARKDSKTPIAAPPLDSTSAPRPWKSSGQSS